MRHPSENPNLIWLVSDAGIYIEILNKIMLVFSVASALEFLESRAKASKNVKNVGLRAEVTVTTRTTPNNLVLSVCRKKMGGLLY